MEINQIKKIISDSPSIRLVKSGNFDITLPFLAEVFSNQTAIGSERLHMLLENHLDTHNIDIDESSDTGALIKTNEEVAKRWIKTWADNGFLANYQDENGNIIYELSYYTSKVIDWFDTLKKEEYVGTESKFKHIFDGLKELVEFTNEDKAKRLEMLKAKRRQLDLEIQSLEMGEDVTVYEEYQVVPRYNSLTRLAKELLTDFKEVDDNFKAIIKQIYKQQTENAQKKKILNYIFDAYSELKDSPQGKSFYAFWEFLMTTDLQSQWDELIDSLYQTLQKRGIKVNDVFIKDMKEHLIDACGKVYDTNLKMSDKLGRLIRHNEASSSAAAVTNVINDIKKLLMDNVKVNERPDAQFYVDEIKISVPFDRQLTYQPTRETVYTDIPKTANVNIVELKHIDKIYNPNAIDKSLLRTRIDDFLSKTSQATLKEVIDHYNGITKGLSEVIGYLSVLRQYKTIVNDDRTEEIVFDHKGNKSILIPEIIIMK